MKTTLHLRLLLVPFFLSLTIVVWGQDIHFSQFYHAPLTLNPALTGISKGDIRLASIYRSQWEVARSPYKTIYAAAEKKFYSIKHEKWWFSGGLKIFYDRAGDANANNTNVALTGSFTRMLDRENFLTIGLAAGVGQRRFEFGPLTFDSQWNGDVFDPNRPTFENFDDTNITYPDFGAGINWRGQKSKTRSKLDIGIGAFHFNRPDQNFQAGDNSPLPIRWSFYIMPTVQVAKKFDIVGYGTTQIQESYLEALGGLAGKLHLSTKKAKEAAIQFGFEYRFNAIGDAFIPAIEVHYHDWMVGLTWDVNVSGFSTATNKNGGPEIAIRYIIHKVYPLKNFKACPLI
ncbi:MAG: PorP/SprF family type IX secretion system membrane protein [Saprospiraceae bacterium]